MIIIDFLINIEIIRFLIMVIQSFEEKLTTSIIFILFFWIANGTFFFLIIFSIVKIIYCKILNKNIKYMEIVENFVMPSCYVSVIIIFSTIIFTFYIIKNEKIEIIEPNQNKAVIVIAGEKSKFKNFDRRNYISLTKKYTLKKIGLNKYIDINKILEFNNYELNQLIEKIDTIIEINKSELSLDEKKYFKDKVIISKDFYDIIDIKNEIYNLIKQKDNNEFKKKEKINLEKQKKILNSIG